MENKLSNIWLFHGNGGHSASAVFSSKDEAEDWIESYSLSGVLTKYPINIGVYDWAIREGYFSPKKEHQFKPEFIQKFTGGQEHYHYENGKIE